MSELELMGTFKSFLEKSSSASFSLETAYTAIAEKHLEIATLEEAKAQEEAHVCSCEARIARYHGVKGKKTITQKVLKELAEHKEKLADIARALGAARAFIATLEAEYHNAYGEMFASSREALDGYERFIEEQQAIHQAQFSGVGDEEGEWDDDEEGEWDDDDDDDIPPWEEPNQDS